MTPDSTASEGKRPKRVSKDSIARISLTVAWVFFVTGFFVLCDCPGWYAIAMGFALDAVWLSRGRRRVIASFCAVLSGICIVVQTIELTEGKQRRHDRRRRAEEQRMQQTNQAETLGATNGLPRGSVP